MTYYSPDFLTERFNDSEWLRYTITQSVNKYLPPKNRWNPEPFYSTVLYSVFTSPEFEQVFKELDHTVPYVYLDFQKLNSYVGQSKAVITPNINNKIKVEYTFQLSYEYPNNISKLISDLDSVVGHEIVHTIQRVNMIRKGYNWTTLSKMSVNDIANDISYIDVRVNSHNLAHYYLKKSEFDAHAYTIGIKLIDQFGDDSLSAIQYIMPKIWNNAPYISYDGIMLNNETYKILVYYRESLKFAENNKLLRGNLTAKELWKKFTIEIYKYINGRRKL